MDKIKKYPPHAMAIFMAAIFLDSLRYKFTDHPNTQVIFGKLDAWAASLGFSGLFAHTGLFSQYVIGSAELVASALLLIGILPRFRHFQALGSLLAVAIMAGAVSFHTLTPLGTDPNNDGGGLFIAACTNLVFAILMLAFFRRRELIETACRLIRALGPQPPS
jgi:uncharacterized membrane protein YphA (DoxX/SURF4 family)